MAMSTPVPFDASDLAATVERARALLTEGDVIAARFLAAAAYETAKAQGKLAQQFGAAEQLVAKARRLQGDALLIETRAMQRIADDYDAAQAAGDIAAKGRPKNVADDDIKPTIAEYGLTRQAVHEARKLRDAERLTPGIVERAIAARLLAGLSPSRANLRAAIGTASASKEDRGNNLYETPPEAMRTLLALEAFGLEVWEPACGRGAIARPLEDAGYAVILSDLVDYGTATRDGECQHVADFMNFGPYVGRPDIVTNPPYGEVLNAFVAQALRVHRPRKMALLLNGIFLWGFDDPDRNFAMDANPPARILVFTRRLPMMHRDGWDGPIASSRMNTAWFIWEQDANGDYAGPTTVRRVDWKDYAQAAVLSPGSRDEEQNPDAPTSSQALPVETGATAAPIAAAPVSPPKRGRPRKAAPA